MKIKHIMVAAIAGMAFTFCAADTEASILQDVSKYQTADQIELKSDSAKDAAKRFGKEYEKSVKKEFDKEAKKVKDATKKPSEAETKENLKKDTDKVMKKAFGKFM